ncbi:MAG: hypothetical protein RLZZ387_4903 [Chloroflexota bacterium]
MRTLLLLALLLTQAAPPEPAGYGYPIALPGRSPADGFVIRHGYAAENTWYNPGHWHAGEDWYALEGDTGGALVLAAAAGEVRYVGANYPGRVVIVRGDDGLYAMYGHLDPRVAVRVGQRVTRGDLLGTVLAQRNARAPSHLHFEIRTFYTARAVNGPAPRYRFRCGPRCPPGPGYWPLAAPEHPAELGWRNPSHVIARRSSPDTAVVATQPASSTLTLWDAPPIGGVRAREVMTLALRPGARFRLLEVRAGPEDERAGSAAAYVLWYRLRLPGGGEGWAQAAVPSTLETGADARPSSVRFNLLPEDAERRTLNAER